MTRPAGTATAVSAAFGRRSAPNRVLVDEAADIVAACVDLAARFRAGGTMLMLGRGAAGTDAQHVAVEFVHPVLVGKRALPALHLTDPRHLAAFGSPGDIVLLIAAGETDDLDRSAVREARERGLLTVALVGDGAAAPDADHVLVAPGGDRLVVQEMQVTTYHLLWELVHVLLEQADVVPAGCAVGHPGSTCVTCADEALPARVRQLVGDGLALVDTADGVAEVSVALVEVEVGDTVLVHAGEAIGVVAS